MTLEMEVMFTMLGEKPRVVSRALARRGRKPSETKNWEETFVSNVEAQAEGSDFMRCSEIDFASLKSGLPFEYLVLSSRAIPALLTRT